MSKVTDVEVSAFSECFLFLHHFQIIKCNIIAQGFFMSLVGECLYLRDCASSFFIFSNPRKLSLFTIKFALIMMFFLIGASIYVPSIFCKQWNIIFEQDALRECRHLHICDLWYWLVTLELRQTDTMKDRSNEIW